MKYPYCKKKLNRLKDYIPSEDESIFDYVYHINGYIKDAELKGNGNVRFAEL